MSADGQAIQGARDFDFGEVGGETWETNWIMDFTRAGEDR